MSAALLASGRACVRMALPVSSATMLRQLLDARLDRIGDPSAACVRARAGATLLQLGKACVAALTARSMSGGIAARDAGEHSAIAQGSYDDPVAGGAGDQPPSISISMRGAFAAVAARSSLIALPLQFPPPLVRPPEQSISCSSSAVKKSFADRARLAARAMLAATVTVGWRRSDRSHLAARRRAGRCARLPFILRTNGDGVLR